MFRYTLWRHGRQVVGVVFREFILQLMSKTKLNESKELYCPQPNPIKLFTFPCRGEQDTLVIKYARWPILVIRCFCACWKHSFSLQTVSAACPMPFINILPLRYSFIITSTISQCVYKSDLLVRYKVRTSSLSRHFLDYPWRGKETVRKRYEGNAKTGEGEDKKNEL